MPRPYAAKAAALAVAVAVLGACTGDEPEPPPRAEPTVAVDQAQRTYGPLVTEMAAALAEATGRPGRGVRPEVIYYDAEFESCTYASSRFEFASVFGEDVSWDDVRAATEQALAESGFELTGQLDIPGGNNGFDAVADDGARVEVRSKLGTPSTFDMVAPVLGTCRTEGNETLPPLGG